MKSHVCPTSGLPAPQQAAFSFDNFVGGDEQLVRHGEAKQTGDLGVDDKLELARLHHRQVCRFGAFEDAASIGACLTPRIRNLALRIWISKPMG